MSILACGYFARRAVKNNFQEKELSHKFSTLALVRHFVAAAATVHQEPHFWRTEGQGTLASLCDQKFYMFESNAKHDLI